MGVRIYSFNLNISSKMSCGVLECVVMLQNYMRLVIKDFCNKRGALFVPHPVVLGIFQPTLPKFFSNYCSEIREVMATSDQVI